MQFSSIVNGFIAKEFFFENVHSCRLSLFKCVLQKKKNFSMKTYMLWVLKSQKNRLNEKVLLSTHSKCLVMGKNIYNFTLKKFGYLNQWIGVSRGVEIIKKKYLPRDK